MLHQRSGRCLDRLLERDRRVAALAQASKRAAMRVVLPVAGVAIRWQRDFRDVLGDVAGLAVETAVRAGQLKMRLRVVIEAPPRPTIRVVAKPAARRKAALVMLVAVAGDARNRRALERLRAMALLTGHDRVAPDQRKPRDVVIERSDAPPARRAMALLAAGAELALVLVILAMARHAGRPQLVAVDVAGVARIAFDLRVRGAQREFRLVVIEVDCGPLVLIVAGFALRPIPPAVDVLYPVAIDAPCADILVALAGMARGARHSAMSAAKRELRLVVVERLDTTPSRLTVTTLTILPEPPFVGIARLVAVEATPRSVAELHGLHVTVGAGHLLMRLAKHEIRQRMIEGLAVEQDDIGIAPLVIGVALAALLLACIRAKPMKPPSRLTVGGDLLVTGQAKLGLRARRERLVTVAALLLELGMPGHERPRRGQPLEQALRPHV